MSVFAFYCVKICIFAKILAAKGYQILCHDRPSTILSAKMFINDDTISLRCAEPGDAQQIYRWENDRGVWRVSGTYAPFSRFHIEQFLLNNNDLFSQKQLRLMIDLMTTRESIGCIDIYDYDAINSRAGIGILIDEKHRRQGYAAKALKLCLDYLFRDLVLHQAHCVVDEINVDSQKLFENQGFVLCGRRKDWLKMAEGFIDELEYQLINGSE